MWRYLQAAFAARVDLPLLGPLPLNLMAVAGFAILGAAHPALWLLGLGLETTYLFALAGNSRFQNWVDARDLARRQGEFPPRGARTDNSRQLVEELDQEERKRFFQLKGLMTKTVALYEKFQVDEFTLEHNRSALASLLAQYPRLLAARAHLLQHWSADPKGLRLDIEKIEKDLDDGGISADLRQSRTQTLEILRVRLLNQQKKDTVLAEIDSELQRIEQQFELALENAAIGAKPRAVSATTFDPARFVDDLELFAAADPVGPLPTRGRRGRVRQAD